MLASDDVADVAVAAASAKTRVGKIELLLLLFLLLGFDQSTDVVVPVRKIVKNANANAKKRHVETIPVSLIIIGEVRTDDASSSSSDRCRRRLHLGGFCFPGCDCNGIVVLREPVLIIIVFALFAVLYVGIDVVVDDDDGDV